MVEIDVGKLDRALDRAIEAAGDGSIWSEVVRAIADATGSFGANVIPTTERVPGMVVATDSLGPAFDDYFNDGWYENDWRLRALPLLLRDGVASDPQYTSREDFAQHGYYKFQARHGIGKTCMIGFSAPEDMLVLTLHRKLEQDFFSDREVAVLRNVRERLMVAALIARAASRQRTDGMVEAFQLAGVGAIFFNRFCKVTAVNDHAARLLGQELQVSDGELRTRSRNESRLIRERMSAVLTERWLAPGSTHAPVFVERAGRRPVMIRIQRLGGNMPDFFSHAVGVCLVSDPEPAAGAEPQLLRQLFNLTAAEACIALKLAQGLRLRDVAEANGVSYETVRSHLRSIFAKTETNRQAELVALVERLRGYPAMTGAIDKT